jgi:hypothetical protein
LKIDERKWRGVSAEEKIDIENDVLKRAPICLGFQVIEANHESSRISQQ